jgi:hypothetical protein
MATVARDAAPIFAQWAALMAKSDPVIEVERLFSSAEAMCYFLGA